MNMYDGDQWFDLDFRNREVHAAARAIFERLNGAGQWDNPGTLPDEIDRDLWVEAAALGLRAAKEAAKE